MTENTNNLDLNGDGNVSMKELELYAKKLETQRNLAVAAMIAMLVVAILVLSPLISDSRVEKLEEILVWFFISQAGIVGAFMGFSTWLARK